MPDLHATVAERLLRVGQRYTGTRQRLIEVLAGTARPLTIPEILAHSDDLAQSSVYRNLAVLEEAQTVGRVISMDEFARYELAEDLTEHHHHLICVECGSVEDLALPAATDRRLVKVLESLAEDAGFTVEAHRLDLIGRCAACKK
jgi:Fe2+ or Zn2+ uptake regulation protein